MRKKDGVDEFEGRRGLRECHRRVPSNPPRDIVCRHLNHALAICLVSLACSHESQAVQTLCSTAGTSLKRHQMPTSSAFSLPLPLLPITANACSTLNFFSK
ncbi:hypothetical protein RJT34_14646 [Clitoria ternatea]|uniref:Uncharacterized protein n=1 Tax=Clitoria ternatea TaxID=43366 RepID=A0AAN9JT91_CLITE